MIDDARTFLDALFARCSRDACLTLTAIHPTENKPVPSRHIPLGDSAALADALDRLHAANLLGWGAYFGLATRRTGLTRWQRGDMNTLVEIPALIADIDESPNTVLPRMKSFPMKPSVVVSSGHGVHLYFMLSQPTTDRYAANAIHRGLAEALHGDYLTAATALRLVGTQNTKQGNATPCRVLDCNGSQRYTLDDFAAYRKEKFEQNNTKERRDTRCIKSAAINPDLIRQVTDKLLMCGYHWHGTWLNGPCPCAHHHKHADSHVSFGFNTATGYGYCFVCGSMLLRDLCVSLESY